MKRFLIMLTLVAAATAAMAQAQMTFEKGGTTHNFGSFDMSVTQTCVFEFTNTGDADLIIHQAYSSCGCTVPSFSKEPVKPGQKGRIEVSYNGEGKFPGEFKKAITVRTNAPTPLVRLYIEGVMEDAKAKKK